MHAVLRHHVLRHRAVDPPDPALVPFPSAAIASMEKVGRTQFLLLERKKIEERGGHRHVQGRLAQVSSHKGAHMSYSIIGMGGIDSFDYVLLLKIHLWIPGVTHKSTWILRDNFSFIISPLSEPRMFARFHIESLDNRPYFTPIDEIEK